MMWLAVVVMLTSGAPAAHAADMSAGQVTQALFKAKTGEPMTVELLIENPAFERIMLFYKPNLERLGVQVTIRRVDDAQYENRLRSWDYDVITVSWGQSLSPGNEQRGYWSSQAADQPGSRNLIGLKNPAVDALVERLIFAKSRADLVAATRRDGGRAESRRRRRALRQHRRTCRAAPVQGPHLLSQLLELRRQRANLRLEAVDARDRTMRVQASRHRGSKRPACAFLRNAARTSSTSYWTTGA